MRLDFKYFCTPNSFYDMSTIQVKDKQFETFLREEQILSEVKRVASEISRDYEGKNPLFLCILNGSFMFAADLLKNVDIPSTVSFVKLSSYQGTESTGQINQMIGLNESIEGRHVVIVEDIVDTGYTMRDILDRLAQENPASVHVCTLLCKPGKLKVDINLKYVAMNIPNDFIVGYGLDYDGYGRNHRDIYKIV